MPKKYERGGSMKGKNWREYEPPKRGRHEKPERHRRKRRRRGGILRRILLTAVLFAIGYCGFLVYYSTARPYTIALDAGHGGEDVGAEGIIQEIELTERTTMELKELLEADGRFRIVLSRISSYPYMATPAMTPVHTALSVTLPRRAMATMMPAWFLHS